MSSPSGGRLPFSFEPLEMLNGCSLFLADHFSSAAENVFAFRPDSLAEKSLHPFY